MTRLIDISPPITARTAVWPGDTGYTLDWVSRIDDGASCNVASITTTPHLGAHADGPLHFADGEPGVGELDLAPYLGPCRVVDVTGVRVVDAEAVHGIELFGTKRLLFKTGTFPDFETWNDDFAYFDPEFLRRLAKTGVVLVGIDTPSVDPFDSKELPAHHVLREFGVRNLEGLDLSGVEAGAYELIALPLRLIEADGSPVRAVLRTVD